MNRKFSKILSYFLFGFIFVLQSCQKEDYQEFNQSNTKIYHKKFSDIIKENMFRTAFEKVNKVQRKLSSASKTTAMEQQNGFKIASEEANVIVNDSMTSYTLSIVRDNTPDNEFENLIIIVPKNNSTETTAFIYKYTSTTSFKEVSFDPKTFSGTKTLTPIDFDLTIVNSLNQNPDDLLVCHPVESWYCYGEGHHTSSDGCTMGFSITENNCVNIATGGTGDSGNTNTGTNTGGTYGNGSYSSTTSGPKVVTATVPPCKTCDSNFSTDPCASLTKMQTNSTINNALNNLNNNISLPVETAYPISKDIENNYNTPGMLTSDPSKPNQIDLSNYIGGNYIGICHTHPEPSSQYVHMFSPEDIMMLYNLAKKHNIPNNNKDYGEYFVTLTQTEGTFAIKIKDAAAFKNIMRVQNTNRLKFNKDLKDLQKSYSNQDLNTMTKDLLELMKKYGLDQSIGVYQKDGIGKWSELVLDPINPNNPVKPNPCN